uniref:Hsp70 family protein n=1 Tax=Rhizophagus irregularis (strain DAOM 181602 / DAOM 197198 / MUCL 43194) TaxID=747089 RepID=U9UTQ2_RHIID
MEEMEWIIELTFDDVKLMFNPVIERIISLIHKQLDKSHENGYDICAMFLVGGFSESKYLQARIKKEFGDKVPNISVPIQPVTAVVRGAVQFGLEKEIIKTREQGDPIKRKRSDGRVLKFSRLAKRGDQVAVNEKIVKTYYPLNIVQKKLGLDIYVTRKDNATYCDEPGVELLDSWCVDIPNASKENRAYEFTLTFGKVEIEAIAQAKTGEKYENTFDLDM